MIDGLIPISINHFEIQQGSIHYKDLNAIPNVDVKVDSLHAIATNLSTIVDINKKLPSKIEATSRTSGGGYLSLQMGLNALKDIPDLDIDLSL